MREKFTPGPWEYEEIAPHDKEWGACDVHAPNADDGSKLITTHVCGVANARLIAAAPDLLSALEPINDALGEDDEFPDDTKVTMQWGRTTYYGLTLGDLRRARAALTKARGETP